MYQGKWAMLKIFLGAVLLGLIYLASASLWLVIGLHIMVDLVSAIFAHYVYKTDDDEVISEIETIEHKNED